MNKLFKYVPLHVLCCLVFGILLQFYFKIWHFGFLKLILCVVFLTSLFVVIKNKTITVFLIGVLFFSLGVSSIYIQNSKNYQNYFYLFVKPRSKVVLSVQKVLKPSKYHQKYIAEVLQIDGFKTVGKILLNVKNDTLTPLFFVDDEIFTSASFKIIQPPLHPYQFDYQGYLAKQDVYYQLFLENKDYVKLKTSKTSLKGLSEKFRNKVLQSLKNYDFKNDELAVVSALLLGQRKDISKKLLSHYQDAGAMHILAVSGLHVGIVLLILSFLLKPLEILKNGKFIKTLSIIILLWMFAFIAGLSASVVRAVTMFMFVAIGQSFKRKQDVFLSLVSSILLLLIVKPMFLFDVGFQLSYLAVFGIIWVQPKLYTIYSPRFYLDKKIWELITVSIAVQVGILPLSLYYFQQFPGLFILSNIIIIPFLGLILTIGILVVFLSLLNILPSFLATQFQRIISLLNKFVSWVSCQEQFLIKDLTLSFALMFSCYFLMFSFVFLLMKRNTKRLIYFLYLILITQSIYFYEKKISASKEEFIVFHKHKNGIIGRRNGVVFEIQHTLDTLQNTKNSSVNSYLVHEKIKKIRPVNFQNFIKFHEHQILIIDSLGIYNLKNLQNPIVVLQHSPKINIDRLIKTLAPKIIIADGSNLKSYINYWAISADKQKTPFYQTGQNGAYILKK